MGVQDDLKDLRELWPSLSIAWKIFLLANFIISFLSITSLADKVFELKGFIVKAVLFYQETVSPIFLFIFSIFDVHLSQEKVDALILFTFISASLIRARSIYDKKLMMLDIATWAWLVFMILKVNDNAVFGFVYGFFGLIVGVSCLPFFFKSLKGAEPVMPYRIALISILAMGLLLGIVSAVSEGLARL